MDEKEFQEKLIDMNKQLDNKIESDLRHPPHPVLLLVIVAVAIIFAFVCIEIYPAENIRQRRSPDPAADQLVFNLREWHWSQDGSQITVYQGESILVPGYGNISVYWGDGISVYMENIPPVPGIIIEKLPGLNEEDIHIWHEE